MTSKREEHSPDVVICISQDGYKAVDMFSVLFDWNLVVTKDLSTKAVATAEAPPRKRNTVAFLDTGGIIPDLRNRVIPHIYDKVMCVLHPQYIGNGIPGKLYNCFLGVKKSNHTPAIVKVYRLNDYPDETVFKYVHASESTSFRRKLEWGTEDIAVMNWT